MLQKSPSGSVFPYYYKGGEIHALKYGSCGDDKERLLRLMDEETEFIRRRPASKLRVWVDLYETALTGEILTHFAGQIGIIQDQLVKLAIVGVRSKSTVIKSLKSAEPPIIIPYRFFSDPEDAKTWLVSDR